LVYGCLGERTSKRDSASAADVPEQGEDRRSRRADRARGRAAAADDDDDDDEGAVPTGPSIIDRGIAEDCTEVALALVDDLEDGNSMVAPVGGRDGKWYVHIDSLGTTAQPKDPFKLEKGGANASKYSARVRGTLASGGAWAMLGVSMQTDSMFDASKFKALTFQAKVGGEGATKVRLMVPDGNTTPEGGKCKECHNHFGKELTLTTEWQEYTVSFAELKQHPGRGDKFKKLNAEQILGIHWVVLEEGKPFDLSIDDVKLVCTKVEED
jgi:hypothetical protein